MVIGGMAKGVILGHPGTAHAVEESRLVVGVGRVQLRSVDSELRNQSSHWVSCVPGKPIYLQNRNGAAYDRAS